MAISSVDGLIAGFKSPELFWKPLSGVVVSGRPFVPHYLAGAIPGPALTGQTNGGLAGTALTSWAGQIPVPAASNNTYLARFSGCVGQNGGTLLLCDRLWHNGSIGITTTTAQTINSVTWPARDSDGTTNGRGVLVGVEVSVVTGVGTPSLSMSYTNSLGTASKTGANTFSTAATSAAGTFYPLGLAAGDVGVRSIQSFTLNATWTSGTIHLVAYRVLASMDVPLAGVPTAIDAISGGLPRLYDNSCPFLMYVPQATTSTSIYGTITYAQG